jgi:hypothetical protein
MMAVGDDETCSVTDVTHLSTTAHHGTLMIIKVKDGSNTAYRHILKWLVR